MINVQGTLPTSRSIKNILHKTYTYMPKVINMPLNSVINVKICNQVKFTIFH